MKYKKEFKEAHSETIGEKDSTYDMSNYIDWIDKQLKSDKEKIENLRNVVDTGVILLEHQETKITQLKAKAERDLQTANQNESTYLDRIIRIERNSVSTEYLEETVLHYKKQIIKLKQEIEALKNER